MNRTPFCTLLALMLGGITMDAAEPKTTEDRLAEFAEPVRQRLEPKFRQAGVPYPPKQISLVAFKQERMLELYASGQDGRPHFICEYPVYAASGQLGPKLREGDRQVPEGIYGVRELNPNSDFHLSLWLDYPNQFDRDRAVEDGRDNLGGEIMIHGDAVSKGCLAMGDPAAEDLFVLAALTGLANIEVILTPFDFRKEARPILPNEAPKWTAQLYRNIERELSRYSRAN